MLSQLRMRLTTLRGCRAPISLNLVRLTCPFLLKSELSKFVFMIHHSCGLELPPAPMADTAMMGPVRPALMAPPGLHPQPRQGNEAQKELDLETHHQRLARLKREFYDSQMFYLEEESAGRPFRCKRTRVNESLTNSTDPPAPDEHLRVNRNLFVTVIDLT